LLVLVADRAPEQPMRRRRAPVVTVISRDGTLTSVSEVVAKLAPSVAVALASVGTAMPKAIGRPYSQTSTVLVAGAEAAKATPSVPSGGGAPPPLRTPLDSTANEVADFRT
jgi:hypothetical protein